MKVLFSPLAEKDLRRIRTFMAKEDPRAAKRAILRIRESITLLMKYPHAGYTLDLAPDLRELVIPFGRNNFVLRYRLTAHILEILHFFHSREIREPY